MKNFLLEIPKEKQIRMLEDALKENKFTIKNLKSSKENDQKTVSKESLIDEIKLIRKNN